MLSVNHMLTDNHELALLRKAHAASTMRDNPSSIAVMLASQSDGHPVNCFIAALATLGDRAGHAALIPIYELLSEDFPVLPHIVPGFGNGFVQGRQDPIWEELELYMVAGDSIYYRRAKQIEKSLHAAGKSIYLNPAAFTAIVAHNLNYSPYETVALFIECRVMAWAKIATTKQIP